MALVHVQVQAILAPALLVLVVRPRPPVVVLVRLQVLLPELRPITALPAARLDNMPTLEALLQPLAPRRALLVLLVTPTRRLLTCVTSARLDIQEVELPLQQARPALAAQLAHLGHISLEIKQELRQPHDRALAVPPDRLQILVALWYLRPLRVVLSVGLDTPTRRLKMDATCALLDTRGTPNPLPARAVVLAAVELTLLQLSLHLDRPRALAVPPDRMQTLAGHWQPRAPRRALLVRLVTPTRRLVTCVTSARLDIQEVELPLQQARPALAAQLAHLGHILLEIKQELRQRLDLVLHVRPDIL